MLTHYFNEQSENYSERLPASASDLTLYDFGNIWLKDRGLITVIFTAVLYTRFFCLGESDLYGH